MKNLYAQKKLSTLRRSPLYVVHLNRVVSTPERLEVNSQNIAVKGGDVFLQKIQEVINKKIDESDLGIKDLCEAVNLSHSQLFRKMKALTGMAPVNFIRKIRLEKAKEHLLHTDMNISEVAYSLGFTDPNYFSRVFRREFGMPPSALRK